MSEEFNNEKEKLKVIKFLKSKTKFQIYTYLSMYGKLSLTELAQNLNKSKSTIHEHLKPLIQNGLIIINKKPVDTISTKKPKIFENIYSLKPNVEQELEDINYILKMDLSFEERAKMILEGLLLANKIHITNLNTQAEVYEKLLENFNENLEFVHKLLDGAFGDNLNEDITGIISSYIPFSIPQFKLFLKKFEEICGLLYSEEFEALRREERPIIFMADAMPMKDYIEFLNRLKKK